MSIWSKWLRISPAERRMLVGATLLLSLIHMGLNLSSFKIVKRFLEWSANAFAGSQAVDQEYIHRVVWAVTAVGRRLPGLSSGPCLAQALAVQFLFHKRSLPAEVCLGVMKVAETKLAAHAWVESRGEVIIGGPLEDLACYTRLPALEREMP